MRYHRSAAAAAVIGLLAADCAYSAEPERLCTPTEAYSLTSAQEFEGEAAYSERLIATLNQMSAINAKAKVPNAPIKDQISAADRSTFNEARAEGIRIKMVRSAVSRNTRNMRLLDEVSQYDEILDLHHFDAATVKEVDPRAFYFRIIEALREVQPTPQETTLPDPKGGCTMEAALSLIEHFNMQQMASHPTNKGALDLILDTQRLEQFLGVMRKAQELDIEDAKNIRFDENGEAEPLGNSFAKWLTTQPISTQKMGNVILNYVDNVMPSKSHYEMNDEAAQADAVKAEYSAH